MAQLKTSLLLTFVYFNTIVEKIFFSFLFVCFYLITLLLIYQYKLKYVDNQYPWHRFHLILVLIAIRFLLCLNEVRRKYAHVRSKRQMIVFIDLLLFVLINISLFQDLTSNPIRFGRKIILGELIFHLHHLFSNENFWCDLHVNHWTKQRNSTSSTTMTILHTILYVRWILSISHWLGSDKRSTNAQSRWNRTFYYGNWFEFKSLSSMTFLVQNRIAM